MEPKWSKQAKALYRGLKRYMIDNPELFMHPKAAPIPKAHWRTIAHNAAWIAAEMLHDLKDHDCDR